jgi:hypothetical protein
MDETISKGSKDTVFRNYHEERKGYMIRNMWNTQYLPRMLVKNAVFWYITPFGACKNRHFGGT